ASSSRRTWSRRSSTASPSASASTTRTTRPRFPPSARRRERRSSPTSPDPVSSRAKRGTCVRSVIPSEARDLLWLRALEYPRRPPRYARGAKDLRSRRQPQPIAVVLAFLAPDRAGLGPGVAHEAQSLDEPPRRDVANVHRRDGLARAEVVAQRVEHR